MSGIVKAIVLTGNGTNCEMETAHACKLAGADHVDIVHCSEIIYGDKCLDDYNFLNFPGGFLDGDDLGSAKACAHRFRYAKIHNTNELFFHQLIKFIQDGKLVMGVCNGFQLMVKLGLLPFIEETTKQTTTLTFNEKNRFEDRWVYLNANPKSPCIFTKGIDTSFLPIRHGEGKFVTSEKILKQIEENNLIALRYATPDGKTTEKYPYNPNGSMNSIAGICDPSGRLFGLMPHPEAYTHYTNHPFWNNLSLPEEGQGIIFFRNAVQFIKDNF
uniref:Phosphoribosylformylglycinamidine (FGAM) synthase n=1 Tax=uncultured delta proteobacterium TaxID=34034 RepID=Q2YZU0_9DELT|nr:Phosphoribosylformylglycinamidine (FGAM) synthase [uncultured delta proteobacterium]